MPKYSLPVLMIGCSALLVHGKVIDAFGQVDAVEYSEISEGPVEKLDDGTKTILGIHSLTNDTWFGFDSLDFGQGAEACSLRVAASSSSGGTIELWIDGLNGKLVASVEMESTGSWANWVTLHTPIIETSGIHSLYLLFKTKSGAKYVCDINWLKFVPSKTVTNSQLPKKPSPKMTLHKSGTRLRISNLEPGALAIAMQTLSGRTVWIRSTRLEAGSTTFILDWEQNRLPKTAIGIRVSNNGRNSILRIIP